MNYGIMQNVMYLAEKSVHLYLNGIWIQKRFNHQCKADLVQQCLVEKQKAEEKGVEFVQQLHTLRGRAFGKVDKEGILDSDNAWVHHLEVVLKGFENKQVMAKVNDVNTQNPTELYDVTTPAE